mgnify:CR=1 FL=1
MFLCAQAFSAWSFFFFSFFRPRPSHHPARPAVRCECRHRHGHPVLSGDPVRRRGRQRPGRRGKDPEGVLPAHIHELPSLRRAAQRNPTSSSSASCSLPGRYWNRGMAKTRIRTAASTRGIARKKECLDEATEKRAGGVPGGRSAAAHRRAAGGLARPVGERRASGNIKTVSTGGWPPTSRPWGRTSSSSPR